MIYKNYALVNQNRSKLTYYIKGSKLNFIQQK